MARPRRRRGDLAPGRRRRTARTRRRGRRAGIHRLGARPRRAGAHRGRPDAHGAAGERRPARSARYRGAWGRSRLLQRTADRAGHAPRPGAAARLGGGRRRRRHLHAALTDVAPDGTSTLLTDGVLRLSARNGLDRRVPLTPGEPVEVEVDMWATGVHLPVGHRLRLDLAGSNWPRYGVADPADGAPVTMRVLHDAAHPSAVVVSTVDLDAYPAAPPHRGR
ncbi:hypothetical protein BW737_002035 [Actinomyces ruminis]|uniref:Xaa-Pro dipeptidyl-peptidase C-terminal domain-containing protein n=1 Tax=Actinomyces ruminis TaxID=1937003 RepID=A0ABX4MDW6_9ACTO|nr:hypothetical protein BW737_002035 [Actinomyces ruminis]